MNVNHKQTTDIDDVLGGYFRSEMPKVWPACPTPAPVLRRPSYLGRTRWAVAASIGVLFAAYLALSGFFPRETMGRLNDDPSRHIGNRPLPKAVTGQPMP